VFAHPPLGLGGLAAQEQGQGLDMAALALAPSRDGSPRGLERGARLVEALLEEQAAPAPAWASASPGSASVAARKSASDRASQPSSPSTATSYASSARGDAAVTGSP
jgi:hypothetical protein